MPPSMRRLTGKSDRSWPSGRKSWNSTTCSWFPRWPGDLHAGSGRRHRRRSRNGPYKDSPLAQAFDNASTSLATEISDFALYPPSNKPAAFIAAPMEKEGTILGFLVAQLGIDRISAMANDDAGLGRTGEIVVGRKIGDEAVFLTPIRQDPEAAFRRKYPPVRGPPTTLGSREGGATARVPPRTTLTMTCGPSGESCPGFTGAWWSRWTWTRPSPHWPR